MTYNIKKSEIKRIKGLTSSNFCAIIYPVSERNMKNQMTMTEIRRHFNLRTRREAQRAEAKAWSKPLNVKPDTFTLNGNTYEVSHDPKHQADQLAGYCGNNPK